MAKLGYLGITGGVDRATINTMAIPELQSNLNTQKLRLAEMFRINVVGAERLYSSSNPDGIFSTVSLIDDLTTTLIIKMGLVERFGDMSEKFAPGNTALYLALQQLSEPGRVAYLRNKALTAQGLPAVKTQSELDAESEAARIQAISNTAVQASATAIEAAAAQATITNAANAEHNRVVAAVAASPRATALVATGLTPENAINQATSEHNATVELVAGNRRAQELVAQGYTPEDALYWATKEETDRTADLVRRQEAESARAAEPAQSPNIAPVAEVKTVIPPAVQTKIDNVMPAASSLVSNLVNGGMNREDAIDSVSTELANQMTEGKPFPTWIAIAGIGTVAVVGGIVYIIKRK